MFSVAPYRVCPKCKSHRGVEEFICANEIEGVNCGWDLTGEEILDEKVQPPAPLPRRCPNGHAVTPGDLICPECNAEVEDPLPPQEIAGWIVLSGLSTHSTVRARHRVRRQQDGREAVLTLYSPGAEPDPSVYEALQTRVPRDHITELLAYGRWHGRAYEVAEEISGGSLADLVIEPSDTATIRRIVAEIGTALASFMDAGLRHRSLSPDKILVRSREPLDLVISGFESGRLSDLDLDVEAPLEVTRYSAPEAVMGGVTSASDWWGLGMMLLGIVTQGNCFAGLNDQVFLIHVVTQRPPIPESIAPEVRLLLRGLLAVDRTQRWQWKEVRAWLDGESPPVPPELVGVVEPDTGPTISLGGQAYHDARRFAIAASRKANWNEACDLLQHGQIARWAEDLKLNGKVVSGIRDLGTRHEPAIGFRLSVALQLLNRQLPLILEEAIVNPAWLLNNPPLGYELITGPIPDLLSNYGLETDHWLQRLAKRAASIRARAEALEITLDENEFQVLALATSRSRLVTAWETRRRDHPDASHPSLSAILCRKQHSDEDLIILLAARLDQFRSTEEIIRDVGEAAARFGLATPNLDEMRLHLAHTRRDLYALLDERIAGFARCGHERCDAWADQFRLERRLSVVFVLLLLDRPSEQWAKPPHQDYVASVLDFFEKKISGAILRGQLVRMTIAKTTPRIDMTELAPDEASAAALLENLLQRTDRTFRLDTDVFKDPDGPERRMRNLLSRTVQYQRDTGINGTYVGFPFLVRRDPAESSAARLAPILLWPMKVVGQVGSRGEFALAFDSDGREVLLNPAFTGMFGLEGVKAWKDLAEEVLQRSAAKLSDIVDVFGVRAAPSGRTLQPLPRDLSGIAPGEQQCVCSAVLFHMEFMGQSLVEDLRQLKQRPAENSALEPMLRVGDTAHGTGGHEADHVASIPSSDRFLITQSDPSQEEAIAKARSAPGLLIQGPPGTGKSQTIVNLVADCIGHHKSVLIVCQKLPALEVVKKRLVAEGLEARLAMVTNIQKDRQPLVRAIRDQLEALADIDASEARRSEREAATLAAQLERMESQIDSQYDVALRIDDISGRSYRQILADLIAIEDKMPDPPLSVVGLRRLLATQPAPVIAAIEESCGSTASRWLGALYEGSPLGATVPFGHDEASAAEFKVLLESLAAAEEARACRPPVRSRTLPNDAPAELEGWLREHRGELEEWSDETLRSVNSRLPVFREERLGVEYVRVLRDLLHLATTSATMTPVQSELQALVSDLPEEEVRGLAEACGQHAAVWIAARYEDSPLHVLGAVESAVDGLAGLEEALSEFMAAEKHRAEVLSRSTRCRIPAAPESLRAWLEQHAVLFRGLQEPELQDLVSSLGLMPTAPTLSTYVDCLERLNEVHGEGPCACRPPETLITVLAPLPPTDVAALADQMARHAAVWLSAEYEGSALGALKHFGASADQCAAFERDFNAFDAAERRRDGLGKPIIFISPETLSPLRSWLLDAAPLIRRHLLRFGLSVQRGVSSFLSGGLGSKYREALDGIRDASSHWPGGMPSLPALEELFADAPAALRSRVMAECSQCMDTWLPGTLDRVLLDSLAAIPRTASATEDLRAKLNAFAAAERDRKAQQAVVPAYLVAADPAALRRWLADTAATVFDAPDSLYAVAAKGRVFFERGGQKRSPAENMHKQLLRLRQQLLGLQPQDFNQDVLSALAGLDAESLNLLQESVTAANAAGPFRFFSLKRMRGRRHVKSWLRSVGIAMGDMTCERLQQHLECNTAARRLFEAASSAASTAGISLGWQGWDGMAAEWERAATWVREAYRLYADVLHCPCSINKDRLLQSANKPTFAKFQRLIQERLLLDDLSQKSLACLGVVAPPMAASWLEERSKAIAQLTPSATGDDAVERLLAALPQLDQVQAFRDKVAGCDPLTLKTLGGLGQAKAWLAKDGASAAGKRAAALVEKHFLYSHKQRHEAVDANLAALAAEHGVDAASFCDVLDAIQQVASALQACPLRSHLEPLLTRGAPAEIEQVLDRYAEAATYAEAHAGSLVALRQLERWTTSSWQETVIGCISNGATTASSRGPIAAALPTLSAYQRFRDITASAEPILEKAFAALAESRDDIRRLTPDELPGAIRRCVLAASLEAKCQSLEEGSPLLQSLRPTAPNAYSTSIRALRLLQEVSAALASCPESTDVRTAMATYDPTAVAQTLSELDAGVEKALAISRALTSLAKLSAWAKSDWLALRRKEIVEGASTEPAVLPVWNALPTLSPYLAYRRVLAGAGPGLPRVMACLAAVRGELEAMPAAHLSSEVERRITLAKRMEQKGALERKSPLLEQLAANSPDKWVAALETLELVWRAADVFQRCPLPHHLLAVVAKQDDRLLRILLDDFARLVESTTARRESRTRLQALRHHMQPEWLAEADHAIETAVDRRAAIRSLLDALPTLRAYQLFRAAAGKLTDLERQVYAECAKYRDGLAEVEARDPSEFGQQLQNIIRREALLGWKNRIEAGDPALLTDTSQLPSRIAKLAALDAELQEVNRKRLSVNFPMNRIRRGGEWTDITRLTGPRMRRLREFFSEGSELGLLALRPVWLTTPDVASQLLPLERSLFDVVIFDEASQMPVEYALPCLYRAKAAVVSGDEKQMPPSSFFASRIESDESEIPDGDLLQDVVTEEERSAFELAWNRREIKDCPDLLHLGEAVLRRSTLQIHYRSAYRELIAYSNAAFYRNELGVPVRHPDDAIVVAKPVEYLQVGGVYANQMNLEEAQKVVELLADFWLPGVQNPPSIGVVTFNLRQAELIQELLEGRAEADEAFRSAYAREQARVDRGEDMSVFVKNVENVQGDERDVIVFSTTFGRTSKGLFSRNFGVLGQKGGERRLNVAVTRARQKVVVVSSIPIAAVSDMLRTRRQPEAPRDYLQAYLEYARLVSEGQLADARKLSERLVTGTSVLEESAASSDGYLASVAAFIRSLGHEPVSTANDPILGVDFSIADPVSQTFAIGVECDPPRHRLTRHARAREIWRPRMLERAYRVVHRVSPYGWYHDRGDEQERLRRALNEALSATVPQAGRSTQE